MQLDLVDVFASGPLSGNPLAVVRGGEGLDDARMLALTRWLGFSETTFLLPPTDPAADYRVRIFYPAGELPFAGHPTLGSARAWLAAGGVPRAAGTVVQECGIGLVDVRIDGADLAFRAPPLLRSGPLSARERAEAIRIAGVAEADVIGAVHACNGPGWHLLHLRSADAVLAARPVSHAPVPTDIGLVGPCPPGGEAAFELRAFFANAEGRLVEDPVTGSLNASVAIYLFENGFSDGSYRAAQGRCTGAAGRVIVAREGQTAWIGGHARIVSQGGVLAE
ncbi:MAG: hypothetical protein RIS94_2611 [Pseudomonadota bacterium]|jgi:PhzF family phenazine biosynthesis protein